MSHSFDISTESPASVEDIHIAFGREDYWLARVASGDVTTTLDSLVVDADDTVTVHATQHLGRHLLPELVAKLIPGDLKILVRETWKPTADRRLRGRVTISATGGLGSGLADAWLAPAGNGSELRFAGKVDIRIPLLGGKLERAYAEGLAENIPAVHRFTATWIAEHGPAS